MAGDRARVRVRPPGWAASLATWWLEKHSIHYRGWTIRPIDPPPMVPFMGHIYGADFFVSEIPPPRQGVLGFMDRQRGRFAMDVMYPLRYWFDAQAWRILKLRHPNKLMQCACPGFHVKHSPDRGMIDVIAALREMGAPGSDALLQDIDKEMFRRLEHEAPLYSIDTPYLQSFPYEPPPKRIGPMTECTFTPIDGPAGPGNVSRETPPEDFAGDED